MDIAWRNIAERAEGAPTRSQREHCHGVRTANPKTKEKQALKECLPETARKFVIFFVRKVTRNREAIETIKKTDCEHPRKETLKNERMKEIKKEKMKKKKEK